MIGSNLTRFVETQRFALFDTESEGLNGFLHRPWDVSCVMGTLKGGIDSSFSAMILWPDIDLTVDAARITRFDKAEYLRKAKPAKLVWDQFSSILYDPTIRKVGHNIISFDYQMINTWRRGIGLRPDHSWLYQSRGAIDTNALSKAYQRGWVPDISSPEDFLSFEYKCQNHIEKGFFSSLGFMAKQLGIPYDEQQAHGSDYDCGINWQVMRELIYKMEF